MTGWGNRWVALVVAVGMTVAACASDSPPTQADFRHQVDARCRAAQAAVAALDPPAGASPAVLIRSGRRALVRQRAAVREIAAIPRPPADRVRIARWLGLVRRALESVAGSLDAQARVDLAAADAANRAGTALVQQADVEARALGVDDCVTPTAG